MNGAIDGTKQIQGEFFMLEIVRTQTQSLPQIHISQPACEASQFMKNFFEAARGGNLEEVATYFSDEMEALEFPLNANWSDERLMVEDQLATFSCSLSDGVNPDLRLKCVLDKSEGYWQIIHGEVVNNNLSH